MMDDYPAVVEHRVKVATPVVRRFCTRTSRRVLFYRRGGTGRSAGRGDCEGWKGTATAPNGVTSKADRRALTMQLTRQATDPVAGRQRSPISGRWGCGWRRQRSPASTSLDAVTRGRWSPTGRGAVDSQHGGAVVPGERLGIEPGEVGVGAADRAIASTTSPTGRPHPSLTRPLWASASRVRDGSVVRAEPRRSGSVDVKERWRQTRSRTRWTG